MKKSVFVVLIATMLVFTLAAVAPAASTLAGIQKKGELVVGTTGTQPPLNATAKTGEIIGYDADLARFIARSMGVKIKFEKMPFAKLLPALESGKIDMIISSMTMTLERNLKVAFVGPYYVSGKGILTRGDSVAQLQQGDGLNNPEFKVAALANSTSKEFVKATAPQAQLVEIPSYDAGLEMLKLDQINAMVADYPFCAFSAFRYRDQGLVAGQSRLTFEPLGIAVHPDPLLLNWLRNFVIMLDGSGQLKMLGKKWFESGDWIQQLP
jgi:polar amino acid transport system substrate-binding protein